MLSDREWLLKLASLLEGEGMEGGNVELSEEFAEMIAARLRAIVERGGVEYYFWRESNEQANDIPAS